MKKFEEEIKGKVETVVTQPGCSMTREAWYKAEDIHELSNGWVSPEDHQQVVKALGNTTDKLDCAEERVGLLEKTVDQLKSHLEKQQPEIPEVPQFVADWYEENKGSLDYMIFETCRGLTDESTDEFENWFGYDENKAITTLVNMKNGYTVKEKRFYLKNKFTGNYLSSVPESSDFYHVMVRDPKVNGLVRSFTQQEIDSMETGSYEQIPVEENK